MAQEYKSLLFPYLGYDERRELPFNDELIVIIVMEYAVCFSVSVETVVQRPMWCVIRSDASSV
jgi:hypothetical protein